MNTPSLAAVVLMAATLPAQSQTPPSLISNGAYFCYGISGGKAQDYVAKTHERFDDFVEQFTDIKLGAAVRLCNPIPALKDQKQGGISLPTDMVSFVCFDVVESYGDGYDNLEGFGVESQSYIATENHRFAGTREFCVPTAINTVER